MNRRRFLTASAAVTMAGFAGCSNPDDDEGGDGAGGPYSLDEPMQPGPHNSALNTEDSPHEEG